MTVISARKLAANRANAQASTGPKTAAGKARSARNAVRHGLCSNSWADPAVARAIEQAGRALAGDATGEARQLAYAAAAAQVELARGRQAGRKVCAEHRIAAALARSRVPPGTPAAAGPDEEPEQLEELLCDAVYELEAIKRYEGRAFARHERAIRALEAKRTGEEPPPRPLPRPRGLRLPRWRLPRPDSRVIRFEGLPRWAWWRPDPLDAGPKARRAPRRKPPTDVPGELELLVSSALLARPRAGAPDLDESASGQRGGSRADATRSVQLPLPVGERAGVRGADRGQREEGERASAIVQATSNTMRADAGTTDKAAIEQSSGTNPPQAGAARSGQTPPAADPPAPAPSAGTTPTQHPSETTPWRRGATPTPLPTCRAGPCRWVGEMPADHWSYRSWRYRRPRAQTVCSGPMPHIDPMARRCPPSRGRSRAPP